MATLRRRIVTFRHKYNALTPGPHLAMGQAMAEVDRISGRIIGAAIRVHKAYGPGLLESVYKACLGQELVADDLQVEIDKPMNLRHDGLTIHRAYVLDMLVERRVIVEVKCVAKIAPIHRAQLLTYLRLTGLQLGLIINFKVERLVDGIRRVVNDYQEDDTSQKASKAGQEP